MYDKITHIDKYGKKYEKAFRFVENLYIYIMIKIMFKKVQLLLKIILFITPIILLCHSCNDDCGVDENLQCNLLRYEESQDNDLYINYKIYLHRLYIIKNDKYNCCAKYITISATICNNNLYITEKQSSNECKCVKNMIIEYYIDNINNIKFVYINNELKIKLS